MITQPLRDAIRKTRDAMPLAERLSASQTITDQIIECEDFKQAQVVALFYPFGSEVDTRPLIQRTRQEKKTVLLPVCQSDHRLQFCIYHSYTPLRPQTHGILEIPPEHRESVPPENIDFILIPGLLFDTHGHRIGYGGGYYDRFLPLLRPDTKKIAVAFDLQVLKDMTLPQESHDQPVPLLITEKGLYHV